MTSSRLLAGAGMRRRQICASYHDFLDGAQLFCFILLLHLLESFLRSVKGPFRDFHFLKVFTYTGWFVRIGAFVFEKVLSGETGGPVLRNRGPIRRNTVAPDKTSCFPSRKQVFLAHLEQHSNPMLGSSFIANLLLTKNGPRRVITCSVGSPKFEG